MNKKENILSNKTKKTMKKIYLLTSVIIVQFNIPLKSVAQETFSTDSIAKTQSEEKSYGLVSTNYNSNIVFLGRKSSSKAPYLSAFGGYYHESGLFINGGASYLLASGEDRVDLFTVSAGYDFSNKNLSAGIYGTKYFFSNKSYTVKSELSVNLGSYADYDFGFADVYIDANVYFSGTTDFILGAGVSHIFYAVEDNLKIIPTLFLNAGTQNYYSNYNNNLRFGRHMLDDGGSQSMGTAMMGGGTFKALDYELSVPVYYTLNKFRFSFIPVYAIPVNAATISNDQNTYKEELSNSFFWSLGMSYKLFKQ